MFSLRECCQAFCGLLPEKNVDGEAHCKIDAIRNLLVEPRKGYSLPVNAVPTLFFDDYFVPYTLPGIQMKLFEQESIVTGCQTAHSEPFAFNLVVFKERDFSVVAIYSIFRQQWEKAARVDKHYRVIRLAEAFRVNLPSTLGGNSDCTLESKGRPMEADALITEVASMQLDEPLLSVREYERNFDALNTLNELDEPRPLVDVPPTESHVGRYAQLICDLSLAKQYFSKRFSLQRETLEQHENYVRHSDHFEHWPTMFLFLSRLIGSQLARPQTLQSIQKLVSNTENVRYVETRDLNPMIGLYQEWLDAECCLFERRNIGQHPELLGELAFTLDRHILFLRQHLPFTLCPPWIDWGIVCGDGDEYVFWRRTADCVGRQVAIPMEFFLSAELNVYFQVSLARPKPFSLISRGLVVIEERDLYAYYVPHLYRLMLADVFTYLLHTHRYADIQEEEILRLSGVGRFDAPLDDLFESICDENEKKGKRNSLAYRLCFRRGDFATPVMQALLQRKEKRALAKEKTVVLVDAHRTLRREEIPDLEDLFHSAKMAPCMKRLASQSWITHLDRVNFVRYALDLQMTKQETVQFLCRAEPNNRQHVEAVAAQYDFFAKRNLEQSDVARHSFGCTSIINFRGNNREVLRCVFEEQACGGKPRHFKYDWSAKEKFMTACCQSRQSSGRDGAGQVIRHPLDHLFI